LHDRTNSKFLYSLQAYVQRMQCTSWVVTSPVPVAGKWVHL